MLRQLTGWIVVLAIIGGVAGGLAFYKQREMAAAGIAASAMQEPATAVTSERTRAGAWSASTRAIGTVVAMRTLDVRNEIAGSVVRLGFASGDVVAKDQLLLEQDTRSEAAALAAAMAEAKLADQTLERRSRLRSSAAFSEQEYDRAAQELASARARADGLRVAIDKKRMVAPFKARIGITNLQPGAYLEAGTLIATLQGVDDDAYVDFSIPQDSANGVRAGTVVTVMSPTVDPTGWPATVVAESEGVDLRNRTVRFRARLVGLGQRLRPGMFVDVRVVTSSPRATVFVPATAVRRTPGGAHVFVIDNQGGQLRAKQRAVTLGPVEGTDIAIDHGLAVGELIATAGSFKLREGALVQTGDVQLTATAN